MIELVLSHSKTIVQVAKEPMNCDCIVSSLAPNGNGTAHLTPFKVLVMFKLIHRDQCSLCHCSSVGFCVGLAVSHSVGQD